MDCDKCTDARTNTSCTEGWCDRRPPLSELNSHLFRFCYGLDQYRGRGMDKLPKLVQSAFYDIVEVICPEYRDPWDI